MKLAKGKQESKVDLQMTAMIDIVFQLLIFFIMTFKLAAQEGDFNIKMPLASQRTGTPEDDLLPPMKLRLSAGPGGNLTGIMLNERRFDNFPQLHQYIIGLVDNDRGPGSVQSTAEVELDCDYDLHYDEVVRAVTAVSGYIGRDGQIVSLVEKLKFAPIRRGG